MNQPPLDSGKSFLPSPHGTVRAGGLMGFRALVEVLGGNPARAMAACGLEPAVLDHPDNVIPFGVGARLLEVAARETRCPHFGLLLGQRQNLALLGPIGFLMQHSTDVRSALRDLIRYLHLHVEGARASVVEAGQLAEFSYEILLPGIKGAEQVYAICIANEFRFMQLLCGSEWLPAAVHFSARAPADVEPYRTFFRAPVRFGQPRNALYFPAQFLDRRLSGADPYLREILLHYIAQIGAQHRDDFSGQVKSVVKTILPTGRCGAQRVAELFSMHRRTLHRALSASGTTFERLVEDVRRESAFQALEQAGISMGQLADMLGYSEVSSFNRAFRRWTGISPGDWRMRQISERR